MRRRFRPTSLEGRSSDVCRRGRPATRSPAAGIFTQSQLVMSAGQRHYWEHVRRFPATGAESEIAEGGMLSVRPAR